MNIFSIPMDVPHLIIYLSATKASGENELDPNTKIKDKIVFVVFNFSNLILMSFCFRWEMEQQC